MFASFWDSGHFWCMSHFGSPNNTLIQPFFCAIFSGESGYNEVQMVNIGERFPESEVGCGPYIIYWYLIYNSKKMNKSYFNEQK